MNVVIDFMHVMRDFAADHPWFLLYICILQAETGYLSSKANKWKRWYLEERDSNLNGS